MPGVNTAKFEPGLALYGGESGLDKVFYLAAKTPGRQLALDALQSLRAGMPPVPQREGLPQAPLRVLELVARDKTCEPPDKA